MVKNGNVVRMRVSVPIVEAIAIKLRRINFWEAFGIGLSSNSGSNCYKILTVLAVVIASYVSVPIVEAIAIKLIEFLTSIIITSSQFQ